MFAKSKGKTSLLLSLLCLVLSGCASPVENVNQEPTKAPVSTSIKQQAKDLIQNGLSLSFEDLTIDVPNTKGGQATISASSGTGYFALKDLSIHGLSLDFHLPLSYNGVSRDFRANVPGDETLYVSLANPAGLTAQRKGVLLKASIAPVDSNEELNSQESGVDSSTRGVYYYEYGQLDYFIASVLESFEVEPFKLFNKEGGTTIDTKEILNGFDHIEEIRSNYFRYYPLGEENGLSLGFASVDGVLSHIDLPCQENNVASSYEFENGLKLRLSAEIASAKNHDFSPFYDTSSYMQLEDSLGLVTTLGDYVSAKQYGFSGSFAVRHEEAKVTGSSTTFGRDAVSENASLSFSGGADLTEEGDNIGVALSLQSGSNVESIALDLARKDEGKNRKAYLKVSHGQNEANAIKLKTDTKTVSSLFANLTRALSNDDIQNSTITSLLSGLLSSLDEIQTAIDAVKGSALFASIEKNEYQSILDTIVSYSYDPNSVTLTVDLSKINMAGTATVTLTKNTLSLISLSLDEVGINNTDPESPFLLTLDGSLTVGAYTPNVINDASYQELDGLKGIEETILGIAGEVDENGDYINLPTHQLSARLSGYMINKSSDTPTSSITVPISTFDGSSSTNKQGFTFSGEMAFDLAKKIGTGKATFVDHKEKYLNDHNLRIDVTGPENEDLSDATKKQNDFAGTEASNGGFMLFQYDSSNSSSTKNISKSNTTEPENSPLKGRFSISSMDEVLGIATRILQSKEPRFKRLTSAFDSFSNKTTLGLIMKGQYLTALSAGFLQSVTIGDTADLFVFKPGLISEGNALKLRITYNKDSENKKGLPQAIEIFMGGEKEIYAKIELLATSWATNPPTFNWYQEGQPSSYYTQSSLGLTSYSSLSTLLDFVEDTITIGGTTANKGRTTYKISGTITMDAGIFGNFTFDVSLALLMEGTVLKLFGAVHSPIVKIGGKLLKKDIVKGGYTNIYFETGSYSDEDYPSGNKPTIDENIYLRRYIDQDKYINSSFDYDKAKVTKEDFKTNMLSWLLGYVLNMQSIITDNITSDTSSDKTIHGEDIIRGFTSSGSLNNPVWTILVGMKGLTHVNIFDNLTLNIRGKTVQDGSGSKHCLYDADGSTKLTVDLGIANLDLVTMSLHLAIENVSSGTYQEAWNNTSYTIPMYSLNSRKIRTTATKGANAYSSFDKATQYYVKPGVKK